MAEFQTGDTVEFDGKKGMVVSLIKEDTEWYPDSEDEDDFYDIKVEEGDPVLLVAFEDGTTKPLTQEQIEEGEWEDVNGEMDMDEVDKAAEDTELSAAYHEVDDPADFEKFQNARHNVGAITEDELEAELASPAIDLPGANTAGIGFSEDPKGWDRSSYLKAWATFKGKWRVCYARMIRHFGPRMAKRWCSALKDEVYQTTRWRNRGF